MRTVFFSTLFILSVGITSPTLKAETISLKQAVQRALQVDPRLRERKQIVNAARALEQGGVNSDNFPYDIKFFVGLATTKSSGDPSTADHDEQIHSRSNGHNFEGIAPWYNLRLGIVKPLYSFGKAENFSAAAKENLTLKQGDVALIKSRVKYDVYQTYYQYLAAHDSRLLLEDIKGRAEKAIDLVEKWLSDGGGKAKQSDVFALQTGAALVNRYLAESQGAENISMGRLKTLIGVNLKKELKVADQKIVPVELPKDSLQKLQKKALANRPEIAQLKARHNRANTNQSNVISGVDAALVGSFAITPSRTVLDSPLSQDPFKNTGTMTNNMVNTSANGEFKRDKNIAGQPGQIRQTQTILRSLVEKSSITRQSILLQVSEQYQFVQTHYIIVEELAKGSRAGRRWMISSYADFEAGLVQPEKIMSAFQGYVLAHTEYLKAVNDYNMHVIRLRSVTGEL